MSTLERLERANPVTDADRLLSAPGAMDDFVLAVKERSGIVQTAENRAPIEVPTETRTKPPRKDWRRRLVPALVAAAAVIAAIVVAVALLSGDDEPDVTNQGPTTARVDAAVATTETFLAAINSGDVDTLIALSNPEVTDVVKDRKMWEMNAVLTTGGYPISVGECGLGMITDGVAMITDEFVEVHCAVTISDPVFEAEGVSELVFPLRVFDDGSTAWQPYQGGDFGAANQDYADYLQAFHAAEYEAVCSPVNYETYPIGTISRNRGLALTGNCASLWVPLASDVAAWVRGR